MPDNNPNTHSTFISTDDMRNFMLDRSVEDNTIDLDLAFSDEEIRQAMQRCAREFNSIPPFIGVIYGNRLPASTTMFLNGTAKQMYLAKLQQMMRNDMDYDTGGVTTNLVKKRIEHFSNLIKMLGDEFHQQARDWKMNLNMRRAYGPIG
jgi:hypothetical protein